MMKTTTTVAKRINHYFHDIVADVVVVIGRLLLMKKVLCCCCTQQKLKETVSFSSSSSSRSICPSSPSSISLSSWTGWKEGKRAPLFCEALSEHQRKSERARTTLALFFASLAADARGRGGRTVVQHNEDNLKKERKKKRSLWVFDMCSSSTRPSSSVAAVQ